MAELSNRLHLFVRRHIHTVSALEVLLFMQAHAERAWSTTEITRELRGNASATAGHLNYFAAHALVSEVAPGEYRYAVAAAATDEIVAQLAHAYAERPVAIVNLIYAEPHRALRLLADAFRIKKD